jgi:hypothetical protein
MDYIHLNSVRARMIRTKAGQSVMNYTWSSIAGGYALPPKKRAKWLDAAASLKAFNQRGEVMRRVMLNAAFAEVAASGINRVPDTVLFVVVDADEGGGFGDDGGCSAE